ncbi:hypothetical protein SUGI_0489080 [Cryptomeria japonica]|nr:hypothetical protein SUGI_0489080 [Cryptomeria japonica]
MDDFYDVAGSIEELQCFLEGVRRWDPTGIYSSSENVKILFFALYNTVNDIAQDASTFQGWDISIHFKEIWYRLANSMMKEAEWTKTRYIPSMQEYLQNGEISFALEPIVLITIYFVGPKISEQTICHHEYSFLIQLLSNCGRLLNDIQSYKREIEQGKHNYVSLLMKEYPETSFERATECIRQTIHVNTQTLLRNLLQPSVLPCYCKQVYWAMLKNVQLFYQKTDGFRSPCEMLEHINAVIFNPVI